MMALWVGLTVGKVKWDMTLELNGMVYMIEARAFGQ